MTNKEMAISLYSLREMARLAAKYDLKSGELRTKAENDIEALTHAIELLEAEGEERLIKLPCSYGTTVYVNPSTIFDGWMLEKQHQFAVGKVVSFRKTKDSTLAKIKFKYAKQDKYIAKSYVISAFGKTVFLTPEAAKEALEKKEEQ